MQTISEDRIISAHVARVAVKIESIHLLQFLPRSLFFPPDVFFFFLSEHFQKHAPYVRARALGLPCLHAAADVLHCSCLGR